MLNREASVAEITGLKSKKKMMRERKGRRGHRTPEVLAGTVLRHLREATMKPRPEEKRDQRPKPRSRFNGRKKKTWVFWADSQVGLRLDQIQVRPDRIRRAK